ncbi:MAG: hypothetical protein DHS20C15_00540 [Planctomycetota bacterium]|nr:MAG: hypothetical protein DHS20C15_00540 [Planctomycetota bacterium]
MDSRSLVQAVAVLVVLAILVRWIPVDPAQRGTDPLGRGWPVAHLDKDAALQELQRDAAGDFGPHADRAFLRPVQGKGAARAQRLWRRWLGQAEELRARATDETFVQTKGMSRNDQWLLIYDLYPIPVHGKLLEDGGRVSDPTEPGASVFAFDFAAR